MNALDYRLERNAFGRLVLISLDGGTDGQRHEGIVPVRAFPIAAPDEGLSLVSTDGHEVRWIDRLSSLPPEVRLLLEEELAAREFTPWTQRITCVSSFATPRTWVVDTDRGETTFGLKGEEDIRRLQGPTLMISGGSGVQFLIRDRLALDRASRRMLERFL